MKILTLIVSFLTLLLPCSANEDVPAATEFLQVNDMLGDQNIQLQFFDGYTMVTIYSYHLKIVAEQRNSDMLAQIVVLPEDEGVGFKIQNVRFEILPATNEIGGAVAEVQGIFSVQMGFQNPTFISKTIPVQVSFVDQFSIRPDEATMQGVVIFQKQLPNMLSAGTQ